MAFKGKDGSTNSTDLAVHLFRNLRRNDIARSQCYFFEKKMHHSIFGQKCILRNNALYVTNEGCEPRRNPIVAATNGKHLLHSIVDFEWGYPTYGTSKNVLNSSFSYYLSYK